MKHIYKVTALHALLYEKSPPNTVAQHSMHLRHRLFVLVCQVSTFFLILAGLILPRPTSRMSRMTRKAWCAYPFYQQ